MRVNWWTHSVEYIFLQTTYNSVKLNKFVNNEEFYVKF